jgi:hypothetical protein
MADKDDLLNTGQLAFQSIATAASSENCSLELNYSIQLLNRPINSEAAARVQPPRAAKNISPMNVYYSELSACSDSPLFLPGVAVASSPNMYLPRNCTCEGLRGELQAAFHGGKAQSEDEDCVDIVR